MSCGCGNNVQARIAQNGQVVSPLSATPSLTASRDLSGVFPSMVDGTMLNIEWELGQVQRYKVAGIYLHVQNSPRPGLHVAENPPLALYRRPVQCI